MVVVSATTLSGEALSTGGSASAVGGRGPEVVHLHSGDDALGGFDGRLADDWRSDQRGHADADVAGRVDVHPADHDRRPRRSRRGRPHLLRGAVTGGDIDANGGVDIHGQSVALDDVSAAEGPVVLVSATTLTGEALSTGGSASLSAGGGLRWSTLTVGTMLSAASTGGSLTIGAATSGGTQTLTSLGALTFGRLTTTGRPGRRRQHRSDIA